MALNRLDALGGYCRCDFIQGLGCHSDLVKLVYPLDTGQASELRQLDALCRRDNLRQLLIYLPLIISCTFAA